MQFFDDRESAQEFADGLPANWRPLVMDGRRCRVVQSESDRTRALRDLISALAGSRIAYEPEPVELDDDELEFSNREMAELG
jgi:hypothetical protein